MKFGGCKSGNLDLKIKIFWEEGSIARLRVFFQSTPNHGE